MSHVFLVETRKIIAISLDTWYNMAKTFCERTAFYEITVLKLNSQNDDEILDEWANHFRSNYRTLEDLDFEREGTGKSREEFLIKELVCNEIHKEQSYGRKSKH